MSEGLSVVFLLDGLGRAGVTVAHGPCCVVKGIRFVRWVGFEPGAWFAVWFAGSGG